MIPLVEAKLLGMWAPQEGQKTDALFMEPAESLYRQQEALRMRHPRLFLAAKKVLDEKPVPLTDQTKMYMPGVGVIP